jgi:hypothetical protein
MTSMFVFLSGYSALSEVEDQDLGSGGGLLRK